MASVKASPAELKSIRSLLSKAIKAIDQGIVADLDDFGIIARGMSQLVDHDEFGQGLRNETTNPMLEELLGMEASQRFLDFSPFGSTHSG